MQAANADEAWLRATSVLEPDALVAVLETSALGEAWIGERLRSRLGENLAVIALAVERREALRQGWVDIVGPPFDDEEVVLVTQSSLRRSLRESSLKGSLSQMAASDLLQTTANNGQSGCITLSNGARSGEIWLKSGQVIDARVDGSAGGPNLVGREAALELVTWRDGTFEVEFGSVDVTERINESPAHLILEAMRLRDEAGRRQRELAKAEAPAGLSSATREERTAHLSLVLMNVAASWALDLVRPELLGRMLESSRQARLPEHSMLSVFQVDGEGGRVSYRTGLSKLTAEKREPLIDGVGAWLEDLCEALNRATTGSYSLSGLATITETHRQDLVSLGFAKRFGWTLEPGNPKASAADFPLAASD